MSIKISEKHGVNPSISMCFWCGKPKNELILFGKIKGDKEAPKEVYLNYEPCDKCESDMGMGITLMEVYGDKKFTGRWWVLKEKATERMFEGPFLDSILEKRKCLIDHDMVKLIGLDE